MQNRPKFPHPFEGEGSRRNYGYEEKGNKEGRKEKEVTALNDLNVKASASRRPCCFWCSVPYLSSGATSSLCDRSHVLLESGGGPSHCTIAWHDLSFVSAALQYHGCCGNVGGVIHAGLLKSKNSVMSSATASRAVKAGSPNRVSTSFSTDAVVRGVCETKFFFAHGDTTITGVRNPLYVNVSYLPLSVLLKFGGVESGAVTAIG